MASSQDPKYPVAIQTQATDHPTITSPAPVAKVLHPRDEDEPDTQFPNAKKARTDSSETTQENTQPLTLQPETPPVQSEPAPSRSWNPANTSNPPSAVNANQGPPPENGSTTQGPPPAETNVLDTISFIIDQPGQIENQESLNKRLQEATKSTSLKSNPDWKIETLPILDNLATQILSLLARSTYQEITSLVSEPRSEHGHPYATMRSLFDLAKKVYSPVGPFLSTQQLGFTEPGQIDIIRKVNLASFVSSIFGSQEIGFSELHDHFLDIFAPEGSRLLKGQGALFLELKTQAFIASMDSGEQNRSQIIDTLFPNDIGLQLFHRRIGNKQIAPSESDFVKRTLSRREILILEMEKPNASHTLRERYRWEDFLRDLSSYVSKNIDSITNQNKKATKSSPADSSESTLPALPPPQEPSLLPLPLESSFPVKPMPAEAPVDRSASRIDLVTRAARAAQIALQGLRQPPRPAVTNPNPQPAQRLEPPFIRPPPPPLPSPPVPQPSATQPAFQYPPVAPAPAPAPNSQSVPGYQHQFQFQQYNPQVALRGSANAANYGYMPGIPHYSQSQPTQVLYERARMATTSKASPTSRRAGLPSQRRPWTTEEENALMAGLDRVKGPHWSQILAMFGPGGTINEALKDRNQVQLKDKARNLKLFFLKSGIEVPYYLKFVTGELRTRAPAQAAKQEARERDRMRGEEDRAHVAGVEGMMALATHAPTHAPRPPGEATAMNPPNAAPVAATDPIPAPAYPQAQEQHQATLEQSEEQILIQRLTEETNATKDPQQETQGHIGPSLQNQV